MSFSLNYLAWMPNPAMHRTLRKKPRKAGDFGRGRGRFAPATTGRLDGIRRRFGAQRLTTGGSSGLRPKSLRLSVFRR